MLESAKNNFVFQSVINRMGIQDYLSCYWLASVSGWSLPPSPWMSSHIVLGQRGVWQLIQCRRSICCNGGLISSFFLGAKLLAFFLLTIYHLLCCCCWSFHIPLCLVQCNSKSMESTVSVKMTPLPHGVLSCIKKNILRPHSYVFTYFGAFLFLICFTFKR